MIDVNKKVRKINVNGTEMAFANYSQNYQEMFARTLDKTITELSDPNRLISTVGSYVFLSNSTLVNINLPVCNTIGGSAFKLCSNLELVYLSTCSKINDSGFESCTKLSDITLPACNVLAVSAFGSCTKLGVISLPNIQTIATQAFGGCSKLSQVIISTSNCVLGNTQAFIKTPISQSSYLGYFGSIYVPSEYVSAYKASTNWATYSDRITSIENLPSES